MFAQSRSFNFFFLIFFYWAYFIPGQEWLWVQAAAVAEILRPEKGRTGSAGLLNGSLCGHHTSVTLSRALPWETSTWRQLGSELWLPRPPSSRPSAMFFALSALLKDLLYGQQPQRLCPFVLHLQREDHVFSMCWEKGRRAHPEMLG